MENVCGVEALKELWTFVYLQVVRAVWGSALP
jgi:hypothetical protein